MDQTHIEINLRDLKKLEERRAEIMLWLRFAGAHLAVMLGLLLLVFAGAYALEHNDNPDLTVVAVGGGAILVYMTWSIIFILQQYEAFVAKYLR